MKENRKALKFHKQGLKIAQKIHFSERTITILGDIGNIYLNLKQPNKAQKALEQALAEADRSYRHAVPALNIRLGRLNFETKNYNQAEKFCQKALTIAKKEGWKREQAEAYEGLGYIYQATGKSKKATQTFNQAAKIFKELEMGKRSKEMRTKARLL